MQLNNCTALLLAIFLPKIQHTSIVFYNSAILTLLLWHPGYCASVAWMCQLWTLMVGHLFMQQHTGDRETPVGFWLSSSATWRLAVTQWVKINNENDLNPPHSCIHSVILFTGVHFPWHADISFLDCGIKKLSQTCTAESINISR